jgi:hypothetical protein
MKVLGWAQRFGLHHFKASGAMLLAGLFFAGPVFGAEAAHSQPPEALVRVVVVGDIHHDLGNAVTGEVLDQVFHDRLAQNGNHRFGEVTGKWTHAGALPRRQYHAFCHFDARSEV